MPTPRPAQATIAGGTVIVGSLVAVVAAFAAIPHLSATDTSTVTDSVVRVSALATVALAAATGILGGFCLQRSHGSRLALSALAGPLFLASLGVPHGGVFGALVAAATVSLWLQPSRAWFDGVPLPSAPPRQMPTPPPPATPSAPPAGPPPPTAYDRDALLKLPPPTAPPLGAPAASAYGTSPSSGPHRSRATRPATVVWACILCWAVALFTVLVFGAELVVMVSDGQRLIDQMRQQNPDLSSQGVSDTTLRLTVYFVIAVALGWAIAVASLAVLAWRRIRWAATALVVLTVLVVGLGLLLVRRDARDWYAPPR